MSGLFCNGCRKRCLLTNPHCGEGMREQQEKVQQYNETYTSTNGFPKKRH